MRVVNIQKLLVGLVACALIFDVCAADSAPRSFVADRTAKQPGDTLTIIISELASTTTTATTKLAKRDKAGAVLSSPETGSRAWSAGLESDFNGGGQIERGGRFIAKLAVTVNEIDSQGNLHVQGEQEIIVNREKQHLRLTGVVRQEDLSAENTIESWRIRNAHIEFIGTGDLAKKQTPGIITRVLSWFGIV
jgi:flagellar L-ring protein precursor FlgH